MQTSLKKNQIIPLTIEGLTGEGSGVGHYQGQAVFVPGTAAGDVAQVRIVKALKKYAYGIVESLETPSPSRIPVDCPSYQPCGGCCLRHISYEAELKAKEQLAADCFSRLGGFKDLPLRPILPSPQEERYRNKVQYPVGLDKDGHITFGFYGKHSHRIVPCQDCRLQPELLNQIAATVCRILEDLKIPVYQEEKHSGLVRHIFLRHATRTGQILLCLVINGKSLPHAPEFCRLILEAHPQITTILVNLNREKTNVILGEKNIVYYGPGTIQDEMCGVPVTLGPMSFYQVNTPSAENLYRAAAEAARLDKGQTLLDLYCGMGTIGLSMAHQAGRLIGVEVVPEAVESARKNASVMGVTNARFLCADAGQAASQLAREGLSPHVIVLDPPRKGCDQPCLDAVIQMGPKRVVMVSCNPATAARDVKYLYEQGGYRPLYLQPADLFPRTHHVECVVALEKSEQ